MTYRGRLRHLTFTARRRRDPAGIPLGTGSVVADGSFQAKLIMPNGTGNQQHTTLAVETSNGQTIEAMYNVMVTQIIR
jgi:hypothetical protein